MKDIEAIRADWEGFNAAVRRLAPGDVDSFRTVNLTLGYNVAKSVPALVDEIVGLDQRTANLEAALDQTRVDLGKEKEATVRLKEEVKALKERLNPSLSEDEAPGKTKLGRPKHVKVGED